MIKIDGSFLEGGGQILRTSLGLSTVLEVPVEIFNIRKKRKNPGLAHQHLLVIKAFKEIFGAKCEGDEIASQKLIFYPSSKIKKEKEFYIKAETAASIGLILQALLLPLVIMGEELSLKIEGGTRGKWAPPVDFFSNVVFPVLNINAQVSLVRRGYYPKGGGKIVVFLKKSMLKPINLMERGSLRKIKIESIASKELKRKDVALRQAREAKSILEGRFPQKMIEEEVFYVETDSPSSEINLCAYFEKAILWSDGLGEKGKPSEVVAREAAFKLIEEIEKEACCDRHLADHLIPYMVFCGGRFKTSFPTLHTLTNIWVCETILGKKIFKVKDNIVEALCVERFLFNI